MRWARLVLAGVLVFGISVFVPACRTPWRISYLQEQVNQATQDEIAQRLGPPHRRTTLENGDTLWQYEYRGASTVQGIGSTWCSEYLLTFSQQKILRSWVSQRCG